MKFILKTVRTTHSSGSVRGGVVFTIVVDVGTVDYQSGTRLSNKGNGLRCLPGVR